MNGKELIKGVGEIIGVGAVKYERENGASWTRAMGRGVIYNLMPASESNNRSEKSDYPPAKIVSVLFDGMMRMAEGTFGSVYLATGETRTLAYGVVAEAAYRTFIAAIPHLSNEEDFGFEEDPEREASSHTDLTPFF